MKKVWIWILLFVVTAVVVLWQWQSLLSPSPAQQRPLTAEAMAKLPAVDANRLLKDLGTLSFRRYDDQARQQARDYILRELQAAGWKAQMQPFQTSPSGNLPAQSGINIYAERQGTDAAAGTILLGGHYDTVEPAPGADDNATAVATVLEAARLLNQPTARTLQLVFFDLEERGLLGSKAFVEQLVQKNQIQAAVILDMVGYTCQEAGCQSYPPVLPVRPPTDRGTFLAVIGDQGHAQLLTSFTQPVGANLPQVLTLPIPTFGGLAPDLVRSDHAPFWHEGIGAVLVTDTANFRNPHYHRSSDTLETIDRNFFVGSAQIVINAVAQLLQP
jgi:hypothetical protein